jgi:uncharacterized protein (DUF2141 family)
MVVNQSLFLYISKKLFFTMIKIFIVSLLLALTSFNFKTQPAQILTTKLQVTVRDDLGNLVEGANVRLFKSEEDYNKEQNQVGATLKTDAKGKISFNELEPKVYYIIAEKGDKDNSGAGTKTEALTAKKINKITVIIS